MDDASLLQQIRDKILNVTGEHLSDLDNAVYLQQIRDAILSVTGDNSKYGNLDEAIYLQQIRDAILGVTIDNSKYGSLDNAIYLQQIRDAYMGISPARVSGGMDDDIYLQEILGAATPAVSSVTVTVPIPAAKYVIENTPSTANTNAVTVSVRGTVGSRRIMQFKADMTGISGTVISAVLNLYTQSAETVNQLINFHSILAANSGWIEGASWEYAVPNTVRWAGDVGANGGVDAGCSVSGTDYNAALLGSFTHLALTPANTLNQIALNAAMVQAWITANYGFVGISPDNNTMEFHSDDAVVVALRPTITITYLP